ncbi:MAG: hypothetical protein LWW87_07505, partial [Geobacteraceae bacterium]|nr:hypothetical protein [Geobacteraceae bacterium]
MTDQEIQIEKSTRTAATKLGAMAGFIMFLTVWFMNRFAISDLGFSIAIGVFVGFAWGQTCYDAGLKNHGYKRG